MSIVVTKFGVQCAVCQGFFDEKSMAQDGDIYFRPRMVCRDELRCGSYEALRRVQAAENDHAAGRRSYDWSVGFQFKEHQVIENGVGQVVGCGCYACCYFQDKHEDALGTLAEALEQFPDMPADEQARIYVTIALE